MKELQGNIMDVLISASLYLIIVANKLKRANCPVDIASSVGNYIKQPL